MMAYDAAAVAAMRGATALDELATAIGAPSSVLAATRHAAPAAWHDQHPIPQPPTITPLPGRTEQALLKLQIRDPALLLRAAAIDHAARDLVAEATAKAHSRRSLTRPLIRAAPGIRSDAHPAAQVADQDLAPIPRAGQPIASRVGTAARPLARRPPHTLRRN
jgi:hypothetical protein